MLNLLSSFLLAAEEGGGNSKTSSIIVWVVIGVVLVLMIALTIIPQKKRQKEQQKMMDSLTVGTKLMTVGGLVGVIVQVNADNTIIINAGTVAAPTLIVIDRKAVGYVLEAVAAPVDAPAESATVDVPEDVPFDETDEGALDEPVTAVEPADEQTEEPAESVDETPKED